MHYSITGNRITEIDLKKWGFDTSCLLSLYRTDLNHINLSNPKSKLLNGNKLYKLKYNIFNIQQSKKEGLLTFGGAFSNHLHAVAVAGNIFNFKTIGIVRGEEWQANHNPTLDFCRSVGMQLQYWNRTLYRQKAEESIIVQLKKEYPNYLIVPEGGSNELALKGTKEILDVNTRQYEISCTPVGTGGTLSGIYLTKAMQQKLIGFACVAMPFESVINKILTKENRKIESDLTLNYDYTFGGFAKHNLALIGFINRFKAVYNIQLEPLYTGKMLFGIFDMLASGYFSSGTKILALHTGGLQGLAGFNQVNKDCLV